MNTTVKAAIITGIFTLAAGFVGGQKFDLPNSMNNNQNIVVNVGQETKTVTSSDYEELYSKVQKQEEEINSLKEQLKGSGVEVKASNTTKSEKNNLLVYKHEPYVEKGCKKILDNSMKMGGKSYNNGFQLSAFYDTCNAIFNFDAKYSTLSGIIGCDDENDRAVVTVEFWGDDNLLDTKTLKYGDLPENFSIDISGIRKFEIRQPDTIYCCFNLAEITIK